jgi:hypothetical protein
MRPPFSCLCNQGPLPCLGDQIGGNAIMLHVHGHNRSARDETSYPSTNTLSVHVCLVGPLFLLRRFSLLSRGSLGEASRMFSKWILTLAIYFYPLGLSPLFPRGNVQPFLV